MGIWDKDINLALKEDTQRTIKELKKKAWNSPYKRHFISRPYSDMTWQHI